MSGRFSWTAIAETGDRFTGFAPYVASVHDRGVVAFQAALRSGGSGVFAGDGAELSEVIAPPCVSGVTSHPDADGGGDVTFYGILADGTEGVFLVRGGRLETVADTRGAWRSVGPLGPTMNESGTVAFRAQRPRGSHGIFVAGGDRVTTIADDSSGWAAFHGLPVVVDTGAVVFRADREDGTQGVYCDRDGSLQPVAETGELFATLGLFPSVGADGAVAFAATLRDGGAGVFVVDAEGNTETVERDGAFDTYRGALVARAGTVIRIATARGGTLGLFCGPDPEHDRIVALGDPLLGSTVADFAANPVSVNNSGQLAVRVSLADDRQLVLRADPLS